VLETADTVAVGFQLGIVELVPRDAESEVVGHLGPDLLGADWDADEAVRRLREHPTRTIKESLLDQTRLAGDLQPSDPLKPSIGEALLDQRNLAGLGTVYVSEALFLSGVSPLTPVAAVVDLDRLVRLARRLLTFNAHARTAVQVTTGNPRRGQEHYVYRRTGEPCRRCATTVESGLVGPRAQERRLYWCPCCQPCTTPDC
jgi:endonuclease-8